jgi:hypothetical protein
MVKVKKYSGDDEESFVRPFAGKMRMGSKEGSSAGLRAEKDGFSLETMLGKMEEEDAKGGRNENYSPFQTRASYRQPVGEGSVSAGVSRSNRDPHTIIKDVSGDVPLGKGRLFGGVNEVTSHGERVGKGHNIGYSTKLGEGRLNASFGKSGDNKMGNVTYQLPFKQGGKVTASTRADGIAQRGRTKGRVI